MPLIKLNRTDQTGVVLLNSEQILSVEAGEGTTVVTAVGGQTYSVVETPAEISGAIEQMTTDRIKNAILYSGFGSKSI